MTRIAGCRVCGESSLLPVLSFGEMPLANALVPEEDLGLDEPVYPLELVFCPRCSLVQITETVPPEQLFTDYLYFSSFSDTMVSHSRVLAEELIVARGLDSDSSVIEIASNDGYLLQHYKENGIPVLGIEPAANVARVAQDRGIDTMCDFFDQELATARGRSWAVGLVIASVVLVAGAFIFPWCGVAQIVVLVLASRRLRSAPRPLKPLLLAASGVAVLTLLMMAAATLAFLSMTVS